MGLEQSLKLWKPLSKSIYLLRMLTRHYQTLQELKNQSENQRHAILHSRVLDKFTLKHLEKLIKMYDKQINETKQEIAKLIDKDPVLKPKIEQLCKIKGLGLLSVTTIVAETNGFTGFDRTGEPMKGYVAVQKKLLTLCYAIWKNDTQYNPNYNSNNVKERQNIDKKIVPTSGTTQDITA